MKKTRSILIATTMILSLTSLNSCRQKVEEPAPATEQASWVIDKFDDIKVLRYEVPGFE